MNIHLAACCPHAQHHLSTGHCNRVSHSAELCEFLHITLRAATQQ
eukprot:COSAG02_NODE_1945_length_10305_cov_5.152165_9_plen_45_part_00